MALFRTSTLKVDYADTNADISRIVSFINSLQDQLDYVLSNLDSSNVTEIDAGITNITNNS